MAALQHRMNWFFCLFVFLKVAEVQGLDNGLALTPPSRLSLVIHDTIDQYYPLLSLSCVFPVQWAGCSGRGLHATLTVSVILTTASGRTTCCFRGLWLLNFVTLHQCLWLMIILLQWEAVHANGWPPGCRWIQGRGIRVHKHWCMLNQLNLQSL